MTSSILPSGQLLANGDSSVTLPPPAPTTTTTAFIPFPTPPSSSPQQPGSFFTGGASPPLIAGFISVGAFAVAVVSICAWRKYMRRRRGGVAARDSDSDPDFLDRILPPGFRWRGRGGGLFGEEGAGQGQGQGQGQEEQRGRRRWRQGRGSGRRSDDLLGKAKPEMFVAWIEKRRGGTVDNNTTLEEWEAADSVPLSATLFATGRGPGPGPVLETASAYAVAGAAVSRAAGRDSVEEEDEEKRYLSMQEREMRRRQAAASATGSSSSTLRVAVLLQMPSPSSHTVTEASRNDIGVQGELAIGLVEAPWTREHPSLREGEENGTS